MLSDFRSQGGEKWEELLTQIVATLMAERLVTMDRVAQDGMRVRADAGKSSFRSAGRLEELLEEAKQQVETLKQLAETDPDELTQRQRAARERAAAGASGADRGGGPSMRGIAERTEERDKRRGRNRVRRGRRRPILRPAT